MFCANPDAGKSSDLRHSGEGQSSGTWKCRSRKQGMNPSQRACISLKWIPAYAGMTTKDLDLPALVLALMILQLLNSLQELKQ